MNITRTLAAAITVAGGLIVGAAPATAATDIEIDCSGVHGSAAAFVVDVTVTANGATVAQFTHEAPPTGGDWWNFSQDLELAGDVHVRITDTIARGDTFEVLTTTLHCPGPPSTTSAPTTTGPTTTEAPPTTTTMKVPDTEVDPTVSTPASVDTTIVLPEPPTVPADTGSITPTTAAARLQQEATTTTLTFSGHDDFGITITSPATTVIEEPVDCCADYTDTPKSTSSSTKVTPGRLADTGMEVLVMLAIAAAVAGAGAALWMVHRR